MLSNLTKYLPPRSTWAWACVWSTAFAVILVRVLHSERCFRTLHGSAYIWCTSLFLWFLLCLFFLLPNRGRLILAVCLALFLLGLPHVDTFQPAATETSAVVELRSLTDAVQKVGAENPRQGYPNALPKLPSKYVLRFYELKYKPLKTNSAGPVDEFLIEAIPLRPECGCLRSFTAAEDGQIYSTREYRAATKVDARID
jgi:hypothetical protein